MLVEAIIQACQQILEREGADKLSTHRIAEVAGVTIGSLYQYFPNKEAIIANLFREKIVDEADQISRDSTARIRSLMNVSLQLTIRELIRMKAELHLRYLELHGEFYRQYHDFFDFHAAVDDRVTKVYQQPSWEEWFPEFLHQYQDEITVNNLERAAFIVSSTIDGLLESAVEDAPQWLSDNDYLMDIENMVMGYLTSPPHQD